MMRSLSAALLATLSLGAPTTATGDGSAIPGATATPAATPRLWLAGPFGRVPSGAAQRAEDPAQGERLDAWVRQAPMTVDAGPPADRLQAWTITATGAAADVVQELASGTVAAGSAVVFFRGPDVAGSYDVTVRATTDAGETIAGTWHIVVPDRPFPDDGILDIPAPHAILGSDGASAVGWAGHGCYVFLCVEVGDVPSADRLDGLTVRPAAHLSLELSDGSAFSLGAVSFRPLEGDAQVIRVDPVGSEEPRRRIEVEAPPAGSWLASVEVLYDHERGYSEAFFRVTSEAATEPAR